MSAAFYVPLQSVEIGLRNACHAQLVAHFGTASHENADFQRLGFQRN